MTKSTITRERIQRIIRAIDSEAYDEEEIREWLSSDEIMELSRMALAAMDSEPVAEVKSWWPLGVDGGEQRMLNPIGNLPPIGTKLFAAPPAPLAVPDNVFNEAWEQHLAGVMCGDNNKQAALSFLNACRAAMFNGGKS
ncbi:TPA: hypothetical protein ACWXB1_005207 [Klebsiella pneumoniae]